MCTDGGLHPEVQPLTLSYATSFLFAKWIQIIVWHYSNNKSPIVEKCRYASYNGGFHYATRSGKKTNFCLSPRQDLDGKEVYTLKSKSTNNLYVMLTESASPPLEPPLEDNEIEEEMDSDHVCV